MIIKFVYSRIQIATSFRNNFFMQCHFVMKYQFLSEMSILCKISTFLWHFQFLLDMLASRAFWLDETIASMALMKFLKSDYRWCPVMIGFKQHLSLGRFGLWVGPEIIFWTERHIRTILAARMCHKLSQNCHIVLFQMKFPFKSFNKNKLYLPNKNIINLNSKYHSF